MAIWWICR